MAIPTTDLFLSFAALLRLAASLRASLRVRSSASQSMVSMGVAQLLVSSVPGLPRPLSDSLSSELAFLTTCPCLGGSSIRPSTHPRSKQRGHLIRSPPSVVLQWPMISPAPSHVRHSIHSYPGRGFFVGRIFFDLIQIPEGCDLSTGGEVLDQVDVDLEASRVKLSARRSRSASMSRSLRSGGVSEGGEKMCVCIRKMPLTRVYYISGTVVRGRVPVPRRGPGRAARLGEGPGLGRRQCLQPWPGTASN